MPHICMPPVHLYAPIHLYAPRGVHAPYSSMPVFLEALHVVGVVMGSPFVGTPSLTSPLFGGASPLLHPHTQSWVPCASVCFRDISMLCGHFPSVRKGLGVFPHQLGVGHQHLRCPYAHSCTFFVVHYVSHFDYGSNYYYFSYSSIFWPVFCVISDSGSFPDRVSSKLGSAWHGSTTTLDAQRLWRCSWLSFCALAATPIFNASFTLCQLHYGFSTGRFLFQR